MVKKKKMVKLENWFIEKSVKWKNWLNRKKWLNRQIGETEKNGQT